MARPSGPTREGLTSRNAPQSGETIVEHFDLKHSVEFKDLGYTASKEVPCAALQNVDWEMSLFSRRPGGFF